MTTIPPASLAALNLAIEQGRYTPIDLMAGYAKCQKCGKRWVSPDTQRMTPGVCICSFCGVSIGVFRWS